MSTTASIQVLKETFVPVGSHATPAPSFDDRYFNSDYELLVWEEYVDAAVEQDRLVDHDATRRMPAIVLRRRIAECRSTFYGLLAGGYQINYPEDPPASAAALPSEPFDLIRTDDAPTLVLPVVRKPRQQPFAVAIAATLVVLIAFCSGLLLSPRIVATAKICPGGCPSPSTCNSSSGLCESKAVNVADTTDMDEQRNGKAE